MPESPELVEPTREYLGVVCGNCHSFIALVGPLDPVKIPRDQPMRVGSRGPLKVECPHCKHRAEHPVGDLRRGVPAQR
jgi:hypothetical protein